VACRWHHAPHDTINTRKAPPSKSRRGCIRQQPSWWYGCHPNKHEEFTPAADARQEAPTRLQEGGDVSKSLLTSPWSKSDTFGERPLASALPDRISLPVQYDWNETNRKATAHRHSLKPVFIGTPPRGKKPRERGTPAPTQKPKPGPSTRVNWAGLNGFQTWQHGKYNFTSGMIVDEEIEAMVNLSTSLAPAKRVRPESLRGIF